MDSLFSLAHRLLTYGLDGSPIYVDEFTRLNREVYEQALELYGTRGKTVESEAELCLGLLAAFAATIYDNGHKQQYIQRVLDRSWEVLPKLSASLLKVQLLVYCYSEVYDEELSRQAHSIIALGISRINFGASGYNRRAKEVLKENQYPYEVIE